MDGYQFLAAMFESFLKFLGALAWPGALVVAVLLFRQKLTELLPRFILKHKDFEASFRLDQAEKDAKSLPPPSGDAEPPPTPEELSRFDQIAKVSPRAAILEYRAQIEEAVRGYARSVGMEADKRPFATLVRDLRKNELIDQHTSAILDDLRVLGNTAAHNSDADFSEEEAFRFRDLADRIIWQLSISRSAAMQLSRPAPLPPGG